MNREGWKLQSFKRWGLRKWRPTRVIASQANSSSTVRGAEDEEKNDDEESIFSVAVVPARTRAAAPVGRAAQSRSLAPTADTPSSIGGPTKAISEPIGVGISERVKSSSISGGMRTLVPAPSRPHKGRTNVNGDMPSPALNGKEARRLEWLAVGSLTRSKGARGETFADYMPSIAGFLVGQVGVETARENSVFVLL